MTEKELKILGAQKAQDTIDFLCSLKHTIGHFHGTPFIPIDWQEKIIRDVYGTLRPDGYRQYKNVYIELTKKQGKSELLAGLGLKQLCADGEWAAQVYGCAADKGQASIIFDVAVDMVDQEPELKAECDLVISQKRIVYRPTKSFYQVVSSEAYSKHGLNVSSVLFDEVHAQPNRELYKVMTIGSGDARLQPLYFFITTAGDDPDRISLGWELHEKAESVLLGTRTDPTFYACIFGIDEENKRIWTGWDYTSFKKIDWKDQKLWPLVNPSTDKTVPFFKLIEAYDTAKGNPSDERAFKQLRLNIWNKYRQTKWLPVEVWDDNTGLFPPDKLKGRKCYGGLDLSSRRDITAFVLVFPPTEDDPKYYILPYFWIPEKNMKERVLKDKVNYQKWVDDGPLRTTSGHDGTKIDDKTIVADILEIIKDYDLQEIAYDPWRSTVVVEDLAEADVQMVEVLQNFKNLSPAMGELEAILKGKQMNHGNNPVMRWMFGNLEVVTSTDGDIRPTKASKAGSKNKKGTENAKIDGIAAMLNAITRIIVNSDTTPVYESGDEIFSIRR